MRPASFLLIALALAGCATKPAGQVTTAPVAPKADTSGDIKPLGPNIGPMTSVAGGDDLGGGTGGGIAQSAKNAAHKAADQSSAPATSDSSE